MPFGISVAPEEFQRRVDEALSDLPGVLAVHDDIILWGEGVSDKGEGGGGIMMNTWRHCYRSVEKKEYSSTKRRWN